MVVVKSEFLFQSLFSRYISFGRIGSLIKNRISREKRTIARLRRLRDINAKARVIDSR